MDLFSPITLVIYAIFYGITMKIADSVDEHGLRLFPGDRLVFGILWGAFGSLLVLSRPDIANIVLAMIMAYVVRLRLDYRNHAIAAAMIIITFLWKSTFELRLFLIFFSVFVIFGSIRDYLGDVRKKKDWLYKVNEIAWYYAIPTAIYSAITGTWVVFWVFTLYRFSYNIVKYALKQF